MGDAERLPAIYREAVRGGGACDYAPDQIEAWAGLAPSRDEYCQRATDGHSVWVAADAEDRAIAYADFERDGHIDHLYCAVEAMGRGIGAALVLTIEAVSRSMGIERLHVEASETARPLFTRLGYRTERRRQIERGGVKLHNYAMSRELAPMRSKVAPDPAPETFMSDYAAATGEAPAHQVVAFGDTSTLKDELAELTLAGTKRATAGLLRDFANGEPMPFVGGHVVLIDGSGTPKAIWRTREVRVGPMEGVDADFAWEEGEGVRTRADWIEGHRRYFTRAAEGEGFAMHDRITTVFERFAIVWPPDRADKEINRIDA